MSAVVLEQAWEAYRSRERTRWLERRASNWALRDVTMSIDAGELVGVAGHNGSGKTTLLGVIAGVIRPDRGRVEVKGLAAALLQPGAAFHRDLTGRENIEFAAALLGMTRSTVRSRYDEIVSFAALDDHTMDSPVRTYSAGMLLRLSFSVLVHSDASVLLVDEVLAAADEEFRGRSMARINQMRAAGVAVVVVSHDLAMLKQRCERLVLMDRGGIAFDGSPSVGLDLYSRLGERSGPTGSAHPK